jgi:drug/metabolite transporter (DMT)-like permease
MNAGRSAHPQQHPLRGIVMIMTTVAMFAVLDSIAKYLSRFYPVPGIVWARYAFHLLFVVLLLAPRLRGRLVRTQRLGLQVLRGFLLAASSLFFFSALKYMPLAEASSITFLSPILVTISAAIVLKERIEMPRWIAVCAGFIGVLIIIRPGSGVFSAVALLPLATAACFASYAVLTRKLSGLENPYTTLFYSGLVGTVALAIVLPFAWVAPSTPGHAALLVLMGLIGGGSHLVLINAYEHAPASRLAPFSYTQLVWVIVLGYVIFGDFPDRWSLIGIAVIAASAIYIATHQRLAERQQRILPQQRPAQ